LYICTLTWSRERLEGRVLAVSYTWLAVSNQQRKFTCWSYRMATKEGKIWTNRLKNAIIRFVCLIWVFPLEESQKCYCVFSRKMIKDFSILIVPTTNSPRQKNTFWPFKRTSVLSRDLSDSSLFIREYNFLIEKYLKIYLFCDVQVKSVFVNIELHFQPYTCEN